MNNNVDTFNPTNNKNVFRNNSKFPIQFEKLHGGSYFRIIGEPSRGKYRVKDTTLYQKAVDGFFAFRADDESKGVCLMPHDLVMPVIELRNVGQLRKAG